MKKVKKLVLMLVFLMVAVLTAQPVSAECPEEIVVEDKGIIISVMIVDDDIAGVSLTNWSTGISHFEAEMDGEIVKVFCVSPHVSNAKGDYTLTTVEELNSQFIPDDETAQKIAFAITLPVNVTSINGEADEDVELFIRATVIQYICLRAVERGNQPLFQNG